MNQEPKVRYLDLNDEQIKIIEEEEALLATVLVDIKAQQQKKGLDLHKIGENLISLRNEAQRAKDADLPAIFDQMNSQRAIIEHYATSDLPSLYSPFFAHMRLVENGKAKDVLLGYVTFTDGEIPIIDWRHAPISKIFFNYREGEEYEEKIPGRLAKGVVARRAILTINGSRLMQFATGRENFRLNLDLNQWELDRAGLVPSLSGGAGSANRGQRFGTGQAGRLTPDISALLDPEQFAMLNADHEEPLLILGGAGCGKTTVAVHRIASLLYQDSQRYKQESMIVIVPEEGLVRLSRKLLDPLGLNRVEVITFDGWVAKQAHQMLRKLPNRISSSASAQVVKFKRHPQVRVAITALIKDQVDNLLKTLSEKFQETAAIEDYLKNSEDIPLVKRLKEAESRHLSEAAKLPDSDSRKKVINAFYKNQEKVLLDFARDRWDLWSDKRYLQTVVDHSGGDLDINIIDELHDYSMQQFADNSKSKYIGIDRDKLEMADGKSLLDEVEEELAGTIDPEDFTILLEIIHRKTGKEQTRFGRLQTYSHILIDEAQDLAPLELTQLGRALKLDAAITIAGDSAQQIDPSTSFESWENVLRHLNLPSVEANHLTTTYRSTRPIAEFAHAVLGSLAPAVMPKTIKDGVKVARSLFQNDGHAALFLLDALNKLDIDEPGASTAIIAKDFATARKLYEVLKSVPKVRLVHGGEFSFRPGIDITDVSQVKGLEFDYVIIPDANAGVYQDRPEDRRLLHVAATRAIHQLWVLSVGKESYVLNHINTVLE